MRALSVDPEVHPLASTLFAILPIRALDEDDDFDEGDWEDEDDWDDEDDDEWDEDEEEDDDDEWDDWDDKDDDASVGRSRRWN